MDGTPPPYPALGAVATQVAGALSAIEEKALARAPLEVDGTPIRRAAAMRVRVGFAFASAPPRGSSSDPDAVATLLGEIDELLSEVNGLAASSSLELAPALGACRNALVKEAIDFSEVAQRYVAAEPAVLAARAPARPRSTTGARAVSSVRAPKAAVDEGTRRPRGALIFLVLLVLAAAGYHGWNLFVGRPAVAGPPVFAGMPANSVGIESADGSIRTLQARPGEKLDPEAVKRFIEMEQAKGRVVVEGAPGYYVSTPAPPAPAK
jgi:hypothetical protein